MIERTRTECEVKKQRELSVGVTGEIEVKRCEGGEFIAI